MWLINDNKQNQVENAMCKSNSKKTLFDHDIASQLKATCKSVVYFVKSNSIS